MIMRNEWLDGVEELALGMASCYRIGYEHITDLSICIAEALDECK